MFEEITVLLKKEKVLSKKPSIRKNAQLILDKRRDLIDLIQQCTSFLDSSNSTPNRLWVICLNIQKQITCPYCGGPVLINSGRYVPTYCSFTCASKSTEVQRKLTTFNNAGTDDLK